MTSSGVAGRRCARAVGAGLLTSVVVLVAACGSDTAAPTSTASSSATSSTITAPSLTTTTPSPVASSTPTPEPTTVEPSTGATAAVVESTTAVVSTVEVTTPEPNSPAPTTAAPPTTTSSSPTAAPTSVSTSVRGDGSGRTVVIDPGHNGRNGANPSIINAQVDAGFGETKACNTTGTSTNDDYSEHAFNWAVAQRVTAALEAAGVTVVMTRDSDSGVGPCVNERAAIGNSAGADAVVSIHGDGAASGDRGFYAMTSERLPNGAAVGAASLALATAVRDGLVGAGAAPSNYVGSDGLWKRDDLAGLNLSEVPTTMLELGNMRDADDAAFMTSDAGQDALAAGIAQGILDWLATN